MKRHFVFPVFILFSFFLFFGGSAAPDAPGPKYVFLFIGDGMGLAHVSLTEAYLAAKDGVHGSGNVSFTSFPVVGLVTTHSANRLVTCSSAAATALATGHKTNNNMLGVAPDSVTRYTALTYPLHKAGYRIGIATSVSIDHATPGGFYAQSVSRNRYYDIGSQAAGTGFEFFAGGGFIYPAGRTGDQPDIYAQLADAGYRIVRGPEGAAELSSGAGKAVLVQHEGKDNHSLPYAIDRGDDDLTLSQITRAAIRVLDNPRGFFAMIEGGKIDWAGHGNDAATIIHEVVDFSDAIAIAVEFYRRHPDETLILVTADHETGGLALGRDGSYSLLPTAYDEQSRSIDAAGKDRDALREAVREIDKKAHVAWTTGGHTGIMVPLYAIGAGSERFAGKLDNTDIPNRILAIMHQEWR
ncbi:MAG: alkaline phosphatase [Prevotellaceae bacterium]|jgi:alkaline phosphatase|nr:alkaline phosphatase [Prevotellaceae bacterium]